MPVHRVKSVRIDVPLHQALKTLSGYLNRTIVDLIGEQTEKLWKETFPKLPMPGELEGKRPMK